MPGLEDPLFFLGEIVIQLTCSYTTFIHILYKCWMIM
jgi:hypothetical protein